MAEDDFAWPLDELSRVTKFVKSGPVYTIIVAEGAYAIPSPGKNVKLVATKTNPEIGGAKGAATAALLECSMNAGANFATVAVAGLEDAPERVYGLVVPKTETAEANWFDMYVVPMVGAHAITAPFLWQLTGMRFAVSGNVSFKIRHAPHIVGGEGGKGTAPMVQMYPMSGPTGGTSDTGWSVLAYRTDKKGTAQMFQSPPAWHPDVVNMFGGRGLKFGKDPPLIAADVPFV